MKNRNASAAWLATFAVVAVGVYQLRAPGPDHGWQDVVSVFAGSFALLALFTIALYQLEAVRYHRLMRGEDVLARWTVTERDWKQFVLDEPARNAQSGVPANIIELKPRMTTQGVHVVIGKNSLIVGGDFHSLPRVSLSSILGPSWVNGYPPCLAFTISTHVDADTTRTWTLRFPVAPGAQSDAALVQEYYLNRAPELSAQRDPRRMRRLGIGITVGGVIALVLGLLTFRSNIDPTIMLLLLLSGILVTPAGALIAIVWRRRMPRQYRKYPH